MTTTTRTVEADQIRTRLDELTVIDVRSPGEYAGGHLPGAMNIPLDRLKHALPSLKEAASRGELLIVCQSGNRSRNACAQLAAEGIPTLDLVGGTSGWASRGNALDRPAGGPVRVPWAMDRQVRLAAGSLVLLGLLLGVLVHPLFQLLSAGVAGGLVFSALTNTCGMAAMLGKLPYNRATSCGVDLSATLNRLNNGGK
ncbi:rhodanese domain containing protein [Streptomyces laurentii]|uniref:Rhodanese domain containing protein n=1 Tax=Streptomyces laurentii TaxID=39478 RepID=A0A160P257_STRLU|nr:rhodanese domain containing protein [Streptomyces laurentii]